MAANQSHDDALHDSDDTSVNVPLELVTIISEGFQLIYAALKELAEYVEESRFEHRDFFPVNDRLAELKDFVEK